MEEILANKKVVKYRKKININVGMVIFAAIFIYFLVYAVLFFTRDKITIYEVVKGEKASDTNKKYQALILRDETVYKTDSAGYLNVFIKEGQKVKVGDTVYTIDENGTISEMISNKLEGESLSEEDYIQIKEIITQFSSDYNDILFGKIYDFKTDLDSAIMQIYSKNAINSIMSAQDTGASGYKIETALKSGIVSYYCDGYEGKTAESLTKDDFSIEKYKRSSHKSGDLVAAETDIYKTANSEKWNLFIKLSDDDIKKYGQDTKMRIRFTDDNTVAVGDFKVIYIENQAYGQITLQQYMVRYISDRFVDIKIDEDVKSGLKIPKTSVVTKDFHTIPESFGIKGGNTKETGFLIEKYDEKGNQVTEYVAPEIYEDIDGMYYVSTQDFKSGDNIIANDGSGKYTIGPKASLKGVYNVNNGYCVFREINILTESDDYYIVESGTDYGLLVYDHIVLDSSRVNENQIVYH